MADTTTKGICSYCNKVFTRAGMWKHLETCKERKSILEKKKGGKCFHILVEGYRLYWLHIEIPVSSKLKDLDIYLRYIWLECCDHLSSFRIGKEVYVSYPEDYMGYKDMELKLMDLLRPGMEFSYKYDFGLSTDLKLRVLSEYFGETEGKWVKLLARNQDPELICSQCNKRISVEICPACGPLCGDCAETHECMFRLPLVNSPRTGICCYDG